MNLIKKIALFTTLMLVVFTLSLSCSDEGDDLRTFLEKHDGTEWLLSKEDFNTTVYIRLNNYEIKLLEQWSYNCEFDSYEYNSNIFIPGDFKIKENLILTYNQEKDFQAEGITVKRRKLRGI